VSSFGRATLLPQRGQHEDLTGTAKRECKYRWRGREGDLLQRAVKSLSCGFVFLNQTSVGSSVDLGVAAIAEVMKKAVILYG